MTNTEKLHRELVRLGLDSGEADVYLLLMRQGNLRISEISSTLEQPRSTIYETLRGLYKLGLAAEIIENSYKTIQAYPLSQLRIRFQEKIRELESKTDELTHVEHSLEKLSVQHAGAPTVVRYYRGRSGARQVFWNSLKTQDTLYVYSEWGRGRYLGITFYQKFVDESKKRNFREQVLTNSHPRVLDSIRQHLNSPLSRTHLQSIRVIPTETIRFKGETLMYDGTYAQAFLKDETINGFEVENQAFVRTQRAIFETLWQTATPLSELL